MKNVVKKNLPDKFPIRYALLVQSSEEHDDFDSVVEREVLFRQLLSILQQKPLSKEMLLVSQTSIKFILLGIEIMNIAKLGRDYEWLKLTEEKMKEIMPEIQRDSWSYGDAFTLGLYSYKGNYEIPSFIRAHNIKDDLGALSGKFGGSISRGKINFFYNIFEEIKNNKINEWELYKSLNEYKRPLYITSYQSDLWKMLDERVLGGTIRPARSHQYETKEIKDLKEKNNYSEKITITVFRNWHELFAEEINTLYRMMNFCNNCGKALPFNYQGKYCPNNKKNQECIKERARKRARKKSQNS